MENSEEIIEVPLIFICSDNFKKIAAGIRIDDFPTISFPQRCGDRFNNVKVVKGKPTKVAIKRSVKRDRYEWGGDSEIEIAECIFEASIIYDLQIIANGEGKMKIEISAHDAEANSKNHSHEKK